MEVYREPNDHQLFRRMIAGDLLEKSQFWTWNGKRDFAEEFQKLLNSFTDEDERHDQADIWVETTYDLFCAFSRKESKFQSPNDPTPLATLELWSLEDAANKILTLKHYWPVLSRSIIKTFLGAELGSYAAEMKSGKVRRAGVIATMISNDARRHNERVESNFVTLNGIYQQSLGSVLNLNILQSLLEKAVSDKGVFVNPLVFSIIENCKSKSPV